MVLFHEIERFSYKSVPIFQIYLCKTDTVNFNWIFHLGICGLLQAEINVLNIRVLLPSSLVKRQYAHVASEVLHIK